MSGFQWAGLILTALLAIGSAMGLLRRRSLMALIWFALWTTACIAFAWPDLTVRAAHLLGIGRGADLVFYCAIVAMLIGFFLVYQRLYRIEQHITRLTRAMALEHPKRPPLSPPHRSPPASSAD